MLVIRLRRKWMRVNNQAIIIINMDVFEKISGRKIKDK